MYGRSLALAAAVAASVVDPAGMARAAPPDRSPIRHTDPLEAYRAGDYDEALRLLLDAKTERPRDPRVDFDLGDTLYRKGDYDAASKAFAAAEAGARDPALRAQARYNLGNALFRKQELEKAAEAYQKALELAPKDDDARHNLDVVRQAMQRREQQRKAQEQQSQQQQQGQPPQQPSQQQSQGQEQQQPRAGQQAQDERGKGHDAPSEQRERQGSQPSTSSGAEGSQHEGQARAPAQPDGRPPAAGDRGVKPGLSREEAERYLRQLGDARPRIPRNQRGGHSSQPEKDW